MTDYAVIGAGPCGLLCALFIARAGNKVVVYESRPRPTDFSGSYPVVLNYRGMQALSKVNKPHLVGSIRKRGLAVDGMKIIPNNKEVASFGVYGLGIMRDAVVRELLLECDKEENISFQFSHKLESIDFTTHELTFSHDGDSVRSTHDRVVGADGNYSKLRRLMNAHYEEEEFKVETWPWNFSLRFMNPLAPDTKTMVKPIHYIFGDTGYVCAQPDGRWNVCLRVLPETQEDNPFLFSTEPTPENVTQLKNYVTKMSKVTASELLTTKDYESYFSATPFTGEIVKCSRLNIGEFCCLVGDAAHSVLPSSGEGINSALESAAVFGQALEDDPSFPFSAYNTARLPDAHALCEIALNSKRKVAGTPAERASELTIRIMLGIQKAFGAVDGTIADYMAGSKAQEGVKSYSELADIECKQCDGKRGFAMGLVTLFGSSNEKPAELPPGAALLESANITAASIPEAKSEPVTYSVDVVDRAGSKWTVAKRYSEFQALAKRLDKMGAAGATGAAPFPKSWTLSPPREAAVVQKRKEALQLWLKGVLARPGQAKVFLWQLLAPEEKHEEAALATDKKEEQKL